VEPLKPINAIVEDPSLSLEEIEKLRAENGYFDKKHKGTLIWLLSAFAVPGVAQRRRISGSCAMCISHMSVDKSFVWDC
jgi:hypothetical protein